MTEQSPLFDPGPPVEPPNAIVWERSAKQCNIWHDHEPGGPTTYHCFSRAQLGTATEKITEGEGEPIAPGVYRFGWPVADIGAHACSCGNWRSCWHLAAALLLDSGLRLIPEVVETQQRYGAARRARWEAEERKRNGEGIAAEVEEWLRRAEP
jgi:hypothetical protein